jgi:hypothetical protein
MINPPRLRAFDGFTWYHWMGGKSKKRKSTPVAAPERESHSAGGNTSGNFSVIPEDDRNNLKHRSHSGGQKSSVDFFAVCGIENSSGWGNVNLISEED